MTSSAFDVLLLGSRIRVVASSEACAAARDLWRGTLASHDPSFAAPDVDIRVDEALSLASALLEIATACNAAALARCRTLTIHAGVVASPGGAIVVPAVSGAGKSTLVGACALAGLTYVSDEALHVSPDGDAVPYPRPLGLSEESTARLAVQALGYDAGDERLIAPEDLGSVALHPVPVAHIVAIERRAGASARLEPLPQADAVRLLLTHSFNHYLAPRAAVAAAAQLANGAKTWRLSYTEATDAAALIAAALT